MSEADYVCGIHAVNQLIVEKPRTLRRLLIATGRSDARIQGIREKAREAGIRVDQIDRRALERMTRDAFSGQGRIAHQGILAECHAVVPADEAELEARWDTFNNPLILVLDGLEDPRNLGACLRSADAVGVDAVLVPRRHIAPFSAAVRKTASGALESLFVVQVSNLARRLKWLQDQGAWLVGADDSAAAEYTEVDMTVPLVMVLGSEGAGIRRLTKDLCDFVVSIPMAGVVSSLNVSVATGVLLFECLRQRREK